MGLINDQIQNLDSWGRMYREAYERGMRDYERGTPQQLCPFGEEAPRQRDQWRKGWDEAYRLDQMP